MNKIRSSQIAALLEMANGKFRLCINKTTEEGLLSSPTNKALSTSSQLDWILFIWGLTLPYRSSMQWQSQAMKGDGDVLPPAVLDFLSRQ